jgi:hypothetical protein
MEDITTDTKKRGRFVLELRTGELREEIGSFPSFAAAELYRTKVGKTGEHVELLIIDKSVNLVKEEADDTELDENTRQMEIEDKRAALIALKEKNRLAELAAAGVSSNKTE